MKLKYRNIIFGLSVILGSIALFSLIIIFGIYIYSQYNKPEALNTYDSAAYISEEDIDLESNPIIAETDKTKAITEEIIQNTTPPEKFGEIQIDESRQILTVGKTLTKEEITNIEEEYSVEFTEDTSHNGVYVINTTEETNTEELGEELDTEVEVDSIVKMSGETVDWGVSRIGADKIWTKATGSGVKVAVVDTGIDTSHPDLLSNITTGYDFVNNDSSPIDDNGHGTHVSGIIGGIDNETGIVGVANMIKIMPVKVLNSDGYGYLSDVAKGIYYAVDNGAKVINLSLGTTSDSLTLKDAINYATSKGVLVVAAAGNTASQSCEYPAAYDSAICVVATDNSNKLASFSNTGGELAAPGVYNYSTYIGSTYTYMSGTSMATPHVAGAAAIIYSFCNTCTATDVRTILKNTAVDLGTVGQDSIFGYGLVDLVAAIASLEPTTVDEPEEPTTVDQPEDTTTVEEPEDTTTKTPKNTNTPTKKAVKQKVSIIEPTRDNFDRYMPTTEGDVKIKFTLDPILEDSQIEKIVLTLNNETIYESTLQADEYTIGKDLLDHSQHWLRVTAIFNDGSKISDSIIVDFTKLRKKSSGLSNRNVLGVSTTIFLKDFTYFLFGN